MQLDALLRSYNDAVVDPPPLEIVYAVSSPAYMSAYRDLEQIHRSDRLHFHVEGESQSFTEVLNHVMDSIATRTVFFLVDDIVFIRKVDLQAFARLANEDVVPSMRLGRNITWSYTRGRSQRQPHLRRARLPSSGATAAAPAAESLWTWRWRSGSIDWGYPFSLDGNIYVTEVIRGFMNESDFSSPNTLEAALHQHHRQAHRWWGICFGQSRLLNLPINRVQNDVDNLHGSVHQDSLLDRWNAGFCMDVSKVGGVVNSSVHEELDVTLVKRPE